MSESPSSTGKSTDPFELSFRSPAVSMESAAAAASELLRDIFDVFHLFPPSQSEVIISIKVGRRATQLLLQTAIRNCAAVSVTGGAQMMTLALSMIYDLFEQRLPLLRPH